MSEKSKIEWTDTTWNPLHGCSDVSEGCRNCYAKKEAHIHAKHPNPKVAARFEGLTRISGGKVCWTGKVNLHEDKLLEPLKWRKPRRVFVNSQSDLFHESVPFDFVDKVFAVMALCPQHTFQVLTKRPERMAEYWEVARDRVSERVKALQWMRSVKPDLVREFWRYDEFPLSNVWGGTSIEDQPTADERIPHLLRCPLAVRFLSCEPLLGDVHLRLAHSPDVLRKDGEQGFIRGMAEAIETIRIHWVIVGGESGANARPMHPDWARSLRDQCVAAGVPFFFKQWGEWSPVRPDGFLLQVPKRCRSNVKPNYHAWGTDGEDYTSRVNDKPQPYGIGCSAFRVGKHRAGRILDGRTWDEYPKEGE